MALRLTRKGRSTANVVTHVFTLAALIAIVYGVFAIAFLLSR